MNILVVGGGISGLAAAVQLVADGHDVELREAGPRLGGKIATSPFAGRPHVDEGADAYLTRVPQAVRLAADLGVADLTTPTGATAAVWHDGMHDIPGGIVLGIPASVRPFATTSLLSWRGKLRAATEPFRPRTDPDDSLGTLVRARFGNEVHERLVDSLVGSIYATDTDRSSLASIPQLASLAERHRSLLIGAWRTRRATTPATDGSIFAAPVTGMSALVEAAAAHITARGASVHVERPVTSIEADGDGWRADGDRFDGIVLATPARTTAPLVHSVSAVAAGALAGFEHADVIMVRLSVPAADWPERLAGRSGYLVPKPDQRHVTAASFGSQKWDHWRCDDDSQLLRVSLGRDGLPVAHLGDDEAIRVTIDEVGHHLGVDLQPTDVSLTRWIEAFPQYRPHHHRRVDELEAALPAGLVVAGASYHGIGIPACIADGRRAATRVVER
jgi:oxygen-dependent protoporphyrinogen oxidase